MAAHLALLAVSPLFLFPFFDAGVVAEVVFWLCAFGLVWLFMEPSRRADEMLHDARSRVAFAVLHDPVTWVMALMALLAALRWINSGIAMAFDVESMQWHLSEPLFSALPGAAAGRGKYEFAMTLAAAAVLAGIRQSLGKQARLAFLFAASAFAGLAAAMAVSLSVCGNAAALEAAKALYASPSFAGAAFAAYALAAVVALAGSIEAKWKRVGWLSAFAVGGTFAGAFVFSPTAAVLLYAAAAALTAFLCTGWLGAVSRGVNAMRFFAILFVGVALAVLIVTCVAPGDIVDARIAEIKSLSLFPKGFQEVREILSRISMKSWEGAKWLGGGLGTFAAQTRFVADRADWQVLVSARPSALSAWWTLLAERGLVGAITLAVPLAFLVFTLLRRIPGAFGRPVFLPGCWLGACLVAVATAESFFDVSFLRPEAMLAVAAFLATSAGSLPPVNRPAQQGGDEGRD